MSEENTFGLTGDALTELQRLQAIDLAKAEAAVADTTTDLP